MIVISTGNDFLSGIKNYLFDLDGCIWFGDQLAPGAVEVISELRGARCNVRFATNISSHTPEEIAGRLNALGIDAGGEDILSPLRVLPYHEAFRERSAKVYVVAGETVKRFITNAGISIVDRPETATVVVVGRSPEFDYHDITASMAATDAGARLLALNLDMRAPGPDGTFSLPGTGILAAALAVAGGIQAELIGKPSPHFFETGLSLFQFDRVSTAMVGDSIDSDIMGGSKAGLTTVLIGTGLHARENESDDLVEPDFSMPNLIELHRTITQLQNIQ